MKFEGGLGQVRSKKQFSVRIIHRKFETNSSFHVKWRTAGKVQFLFFRRFFSSTDKILILGGGLSTRQ